MIDIKEGDNGKAKEQEPPKSNDIKICEIWIKDGQLYMEAAQHFWTDKVMAIGILEMCKDIVKTFKPPNEKKSIITGEHNIFNFVRGKKD